MSGQVATPKQMARKLVRLLRPQRPDYPYLKKVFQHTRELLEIRPSKAKKRLPELLTSVLLSLSLLNSDSALVEINMFQPDLGELGISRSCVDQQLDHDHVDGIARVPHRFVKANQFGIFPASFRGELVQYMSHCREQGATYLFESNRLKPFSTRRIRQIIHRYASEAGIEKHVYPHLFRHQIITFLTRKGIISPKLQLLSGHSEEKSLAIYRDLALADVADDYETAMQTFPIK